jgi:hypothetical protein
VFLKYYGTVPQKFGMIHSSDGSLYGGINFYEIGDSEYRIPLMRPLQGFGRNFVPHTILLDSAIRSSNAFYSKELPKAPGIVMHDLKMSLIWP